MTELVDRICGNCQYWARMLFASGYQAGFHAAMHHLTDQARVVQGEMLALAQELGVDTYRERADAARH